MKKFVRVVGAAILRDGLILCAQRAAGGSLPLLWEFPGGKIEPNESPRQALIREVAEELQCGVEVGDLVITTTHTYDFAVVELSTFYCQISEGTPMLSEHEAIVWLAAKDLQKLRWAPADIPAVKLVEQKFFSQ